MSTDPIKNEKNYINKIEGRVGNGGGVELIAVSLYKKNSKPPLLSHSLL
ncbi:hypothetical protein [Acinetobacter junii]|nr:hypothetical protein [Acinetobacter junii]QUS51693.1 hypothetical protein J5N61_07055 [Acinetobacter junii]